LGIVVEPSPVGHQLVEGSLTGVPKGSVAHIVGHGHGLGQLGVDEQSARQRAGDLGHLKGMGEPSAVVIALVDDKDLGLVLQTAEGRGMENAVTVALKRRTVGVFGLRIGAPARVAGYLGVGGELLSLQGLQSLSRGQHGISLRK